MCWLLSLWFVLELTSLSCTDVSWFRQLSLFMEHQFTTSHRRTLCQRKDLMNPLQIETPTQIQFIQDVHVQLVMKCQQVNHHFSAVLCPEQTVGDSGKKRLPFSRNKPPVEPEPGWTAICIDQLVMERTRDKYKITGPGSVYVLQV